MAQTLGIRVHEVPDQRSKLFSGWRSHSLFEPTLCRWKSDMKTVHVCLDSMVINMFLAETSQTGRKGFSLSPFATAFAVSQPFGISFSYYGWAVFSIVPAIAVVCHPKLQLFDLLRVTNYHFVNVIHVVGQVGLNLSLVYLSNRPSSWPM